MSKWIKISIFSGYYVVIYWISWHIIHDKSIINIHYCQVPIADIQDIELQVQYLKDKLKIISATTAPVNLGQTDWSDDESDDEVKVENNDPENDEVTDANKGLIMKLEYHRLLWPDIGHFDMSRFKCQIFDQTSAV